MTAREQARDAVRDTLTKKNSGKGTTHAKVADAASAVWEPLLRNLIDAVDSMSFEAWSEIKSHTAYIAAQEALGE